MLSSVIGSSVVAGNQVASRTVGHLVLVNRLDWFLFLQQFPAWLRSLLYFSPGFRLKSCACIVINCGCVSLGFPRSRTLGCLLRHRGLVATTLVQYSVVFFLSLSLWSVVMHLCFPTMIFFYIVYRMTRGVRCRCGCVLGLVRCHKGHVQGENELKLFVLW